MAIFLREDSEQAIKKDVKVPDKLVKKMQVVDKTLGEKYPQSQGAKRAKKIASGGEYNKKGKTNPHKDKGTYISFAELKRADHELRHCKNPKSLKFQLNGGQEMADFYHNELNRVRRSVKQPEIVKAVKQNSVSVEKPKTDDLKPIKVNGGEIHVNENKKIYIGESQLVKLNEYYADQRLPFEEEEYGQKNTLDHFIDFLESIGRYGQLPHTNITSDSILGKYIEPNMYGAFRNWLETEDQYCDDHIRNFVEDNLVFNTNYFNETINSVDDLDDMVFYDFDEFKEQCLTPSGIEALNDYLFDAFKGGLDEYGFLYGGLHTENGLIYAERLIILPKANATDYSVARYYSNENLFEYLSNNYKGIGECWSWHDGGGENYNSVRYSDPTSDFIVKAWVHPDSVNWGATVELNSYMPEERELRLSLGTYAQVFSIEMRDADGKKYVHNFKKPILVKI